MGVFFISYLTWINNFSFLAIIFLRLDSNVEARNLTEVASCKMPIECEQMNYNSKQHNFLPLFQNRTVTWKSNINGPWLKFVVLNSFRPSIHSSKIHGVAGLITAELTNTRIHGQHQKYQDRFQTPLRLLNRFGSRDIWRDEMARLLFIGLGR